VASVIKYGDNILKVLQRAHSLLHLAACPALISVRIQLVSVSTARRGKPSTAVAAAAAQNFTTASSVVFGTLLSVVLFGFRPKLQFAWGATLVAVAAFVYATNGRASPADADEAHEEQDTLVAGEHCAHAAETESSMRIADSV